MRKIKQLRASLLAVACSLSMAAFAQGGEPRSIDIPPGDLVGSLQALTQQSGAEFVYREDLLSGLRTQGARGTMTAEAALAKLLEGSGFGVERDPSGALMILKSDASAPQPNRPAPTGAAATPPAQASQDDASSQDVKSLSTVSVSASRIDKAGFVAPTPTTVIGEIELQQGFRTNIGAVLNDLPAFKPASTPQTNATSTGTGLTNVDLRGLGGSRTLVLMDGRRFLSIGDLNIVDLNSIPMALVKSVDVVTGGASAAWGSDAVAGVINVVMDDRFQGLELEARSGLSERNDGFEYFVSAAGGTDFAGGRGHVIFSAELLDNEGVAPKTARRHYGRWGQVRNPAHTETNGQEPYILSPNVTMANASRGGLILTGALQGQTFNPDGTLRPFEYGIRETAGGLSLGNSMIGGEGDSWDDFTAAITPQRRYGFFSRATWDLNDAVRLSVDGRFSKMYNHYNWFPDSNLGNLVIQADNAFLSQDIRDQLAAAGETQFTMGRLNHDFAQLDVDFERRTHQFSVALDGVFGDYWRWDAYVSRGHAETFFWFGNFRRVKEYAQAVDSVLHPVTGDPVCRVALADPGTSGGNPDLTPETSTTTTIGLVYEPGFAPGLSLSLDHFDINIDNIISTISAQELLRRCHDGTVALCDYIDRDPQTQKILRIWRPWLNLARYETSGFDFEALYNFAGERLGIPGDFRVRGMVTYVDELATDDGVNRIDTVGNGNGVPRWRASLSLRYQNGGLGLDLRARHVDSLYYNNLVQLENNRRGTYTYYDLGWQYDLGREGGRFGVFGGVNNLFDKAPPVATASAYYDLMGRYYTLGARFRF